MRKRILFTLCCIPLLGSLLAFSPLAAVEPLPKGVSLEEFQAKMERKGEQNALEQEAFNLSMERNISITEENSEVCDAIKLVTKNLAGGFTNYTTSHSGAWHAIVSVSGTGNHVVLEDGSGWLVCELDASKTLAWITSDTILITLAPWYSWYDYVLVNCRTGSLVRVTFEEAPTYNTQSTLWITEIECNKGRIRLNDSTLWIIAPFSSNTIKRWQVGQRVILGINNRMFSSSYVNFMINEDVNEFVKAKCLY